MIALDFNEIDRIFDRYRSKNFFSGGVCYISVDGKRVFHKAYGTSNLIGNERCNVNTIFDLASVTKIVTTTLILKMISESIVSLSTRLDKCLPAVKQNYDLAPITIKQLLTHSSGLKAWHPFYTHKPQDTVFEVLNNINVTHKTDEKVVYSDLNFILLGEVIKNHFQSSLQTAVQNELASSLNLKTLTYNPESKENIAATEFGNRIEKGMCQERHVQFDNWRDDDVPIIGNVNDGNTFYYFNGESGHAGLFSNVKDIVSIGELYVKGGVHDGKDLISNDLIEESLKKQVDNRGIGWETSDVYPEGFGHTGFTGTALWVEPKRKIAAGLLTNRLHVEVPTTINAFRREVFGEILKQLS